MGSPAKHLILAACLAAQIGWTARAPQLKTRINLQQLMKEPPGVGKARHSIDALSFSHDGHKIALAAVAHSQNRAALMHVVVVDWDKPHPAVRVLGTSTQKLLWSANRSLRWSNDDSALLFQDVGEDIVLLDADSGMPRCSIGRSSMRLPLTGAFAGPSRFFAASAAPKPNTTPPAFETILSFYDFDCRVVDEVYYPQQVPGVSDAAGPFIVLEPSRAIAILRGPAWKEWKTIPDERHNTGALVLLNHARILCEGSLFESGGATVHCWSIHDNDVTPLHGYTAPPGGTVPIRGAAAAPRVAFLKSSASEESAGHKSTLHFGPYIVWEPETGTTFAEVPPHLQHITAPSGSGPERLEAPYDLALSDDGTLLALAGEDNLEIYTLPVVTHNAQ